MYMLFFYPGVRACMVFFNRVGLFRIAKDVPTFVVIRNKNRNLFNTSKNLFYREKKKGEYKSTVLGGE